MWVNRKQGVCLEMGENMRTNPPRGGREPLKGRGRGARAENAGDAAPAHPPYSGPVGRLVAQKRGAMDEAHKSGELKRLVGEIAPEEGNREQATGNRGEAERALPLEVPLINRVAAGYPREFTDLGYPARAAAEYVRCPDLSDPDA